MKGACRASCLGRVLWQDGLAGAGLVFDAQSLSFGGGNAEGQPGGRDEVVSGHVHGAPESGAGEIAGGRGVLEGVSVEQLSGVPQGAREAAGLAQGQPVAWRAQDSKGQRGWGGDDDDAQMDRGGVADGSLDARIEFPIQATAEAEARK